MFPVPYSWCLSHSTSQINTFQTNRFWHSQGQRREIHPASNSCPIHSEPLPLSNSTAVAWPRPSSALVAAALPCLLSFNTLPLFPLPPATAWFSRVIHPQLVLPRASHHLCILSSTLCPKCRSHHIMALLKVLLSFPLFCTQCLRSLGWHSRLCVI